MGSGRGQVVSIKENQRSWGLRFYGGQGAGQRWKESEICEMYVRVDWTACRRGGQFG